MTNNFDFLLAKSYDPNHPVPTFAKLVPHLRAVEHAGKSIVEVTGELILKQLDLPYDPWFSRLQRSVAVSCLCHDIGKANHSFQLMVRGKLAPHKQPVRHELLSALLLQKEHSPVRTWALKLLDIEEKFGDAKLLLNCVIGAVGGHHLKLDTEWEKASIALHQGGCGTEVKLLLTHKDLTSLLGKRLEKEYYFSLVDENSNYLGKEKPFFKKESKKWKDYLKKDLEWWRFAAVVKAITVAADVAGSAMLPEKENIREWINKTLSNRVTFTDMQSVVKERLNGKALRPFQQEIGSSNSQVTLVEAGCGSGKTLSAYLWAERHSDGKKLFFCYPTTGTATEGFKGYVYETEFEAKLIHSRAIIDLEGLAKVNDGEDNDHILRVESLSAWSPKIIICTIDTVLSLVRNNRKGLYNSPAILSAAFVFDELHSYTDRMLEAVIVFIKALPGASFLLMSASLPQSRKDLLRKHFPNLATVSSPKDLEKVPRYIFRKTSKCEALKVSFESLKEGKKVLWICNTVKQAQADFTYFKNSGYKAINYHSRFKYKDRIEKHQALMSEFQRSDFEGVIGITTQVAEMSLDLDADLLISEIAPVSALIQRLGRLNRRVTEERPGESRQAIFLQADKPDPYPPEMLEQASSWLKNLMQLDRPLSQEDLIQEFHKLSLNEHFEINVKSNWLDSGWFAEPESVREANYSVSIILEEDKNICQSSKEELIRHTISFNFDQNKGMKNWQEIKGTLIAPSETIKYNKEIGASWK